MNASTLAFVVAVLAFVGFAIVVVLAFLPFIQHVTAVLPR